MNRIKTLKLKKGRERGMEKFKKIHKKKKEREEKFFNVIIELSDECRNEAKKNKIEKTIFSIREKLESYKLKKGLLDNSPEIDCVLIPSTNEEIDTFKDKKFKEFIRNLGFVPPEDEYENDIVIEEKEYTNNEDMINVDKEKDEIKNNHEEKLEKIDLQIIQDDESKIINKMNKNYNMNKFWKINPKSDSTDIEIMIEKLQNFEKVINENMIVNDEYEEKKKKHKKDKKHKKKKHKKDKKNRKDKKNKKEKNKERENEIESESEKESENDERSSYVSNKESKEGRSGK